MARRTNTPTRQIQKFVKDNREELDYIIQTGGSEECQKFMGDILTFVWECASVEGLNNGDRWALKTLYKNLTNPPPSLEEWEEEFTERCNYTFSPYTDLQQKMCEVDNELRHQREIGKKERRK